MGVAATFISANLVRRLGMLKVCFFREKSCSWCLEPSILVLVLMNLMYQAGAAGLIFQASLLTIAVAVYWSGSLSQQTPLLFFLCLIVSRLVKHRDQWDEIPVMFYYSFTNGLYVWISISDIFHGFNMSFFSLFFESHNFLAWWINLLLCVGTIKVGAHVI